MIDWSLHLAGLLLTLLLVLLTWIVSVFKRNVSIVDSTWSLRFPAIACLYGFGSALLDRRSSTLPSKTLITPTKQTYPGG